MTRRFFRAPLLLLADAFVLGSVLNIAAMARGVIPWWNPLLTPVVGPVLIAVVAIYLVDGYRPRTDMISLDFTSMHMIALVSACALTLLATFVVAPASFPLKQSRAVIALGFAAFWPLSLGLRRTLQLADAPKQRQRNVLFIGSAEDSAAFAEECKRTRLGVHVIDADYAVTLAPFETADPVNDYRRIVQRIAIGEIEVEAVVLRESARGLSDPAIQILQELYFQGVPTYTLELFHQVYWRKIPLYRINNTWLFQEGFKVAREPVFERLKRFSDIVLALAGLLLATPLIAGCAIGILATDGGPVFFRQTRIGRNRLPFQALKLRSMRNRPIADGIDQRYTAENDPRVTPLGRFMRQTRIDEVPQLWNVLKGDMSLIGPRAEWDQLVADYEKQIPCYHFRHLVRPGITGWAQINYPYGANLDDTLRKLEYDLYYIRHYSFRMDASIILKTIHVMLFGKGR